MNRCWRKKEEICRLLNWISLAIEMVAPRMADLDMESLYRRLQLMPENFLTKETVPLGIVRYQLELLKE